MLLKARKRIGRKACKRIGAIAAAGIMGEAIVVVREFGDLPFLYRA